MADPAEDLDHINATQDDAETSATDGSKTPGDSAEARQPDEAQAADDGSDDSDLTSDPLLLAQMEPETTEDAKAEPPKPTTHPTAKTATPPKAAAKEPPKPADQAKPDEPKPDEVDPDVAEAIQDLPKEDWEKLTHKGKSQYLAQRKVIRTSQERLKAESTARKQAEEQYQTVEKFVRDQGLGEEEYANTVAIAGLIKRNDPRAIPVLEQTLISLRKAAGQPETPTAPATPQLDDDLNALMQEAEDLGIDTSKVRAKFKAPEPKPAAKPTPTAPVATATQPVQDNGSGDDRENVAIIQYLVKRGVADPVAHVQGLLNADPDLANKPVGERYEAIIEAHSKAGTQATKAQPTVRTTQPLSGRGRPAAGGGRTVQPITDPIKLATMPRVR